MVLKHHQVHYPALDRIQLEAGRFHLPIGVWYHTKWLNKLPSPPPLYEHTHGEPARQALMPIPFDVGAMATWTFPVAAGWRTSAAAWVSQGPRPGASTHTHDEEEGAPDASALAWGSNYDDNNADKVVGRHLQPVP